MISVDYKFIQMHFHLDVVCNKRVLHLHSVKFVSGVKFTFMKVIRVTSVCYTFIKMWLQQKTLYLNTGVVCYMSVFHFHVSVLCYKCWFYFFKADVVPYKHRLHFSKKVWSFKFTFRYICTLMMFIPPTIYFPINISPISRNKRNNRHGLLRL